MRSRHVLPAVALVSALGIAGCASTTNGTGDTGPTPKSSGHGGGQSTGGDTTPPSDVTPTGAVALGTLMQQAVANVTSAHISLSFDVAGTSITGQGDEQLAAGKLTALDITEDLGSSIGSFEIIVAGGKTYAKLPDSINPSNKPWVLVSENSSSSVVQQLATSINSTLQQASVGSVNEFVNAAKSVDLKGPATVDGVDTTHYSIDVDPSALPTSMSASESIAAAGIKDIPIELYIDDQGRPVELTEHITAAGDTVDVKIDITKYNDPVSISAPPASQVSTD